MSNCPFLPTSEDDGSDSGPQSNSPETTQLSAPKSNFGLSALHPSRDDVWSYTRRNPSPVLQQADVVKACCLRAPLLCWCFVAFTVAIKEVTPQRLAIDPGDIFTKQTAAAWLYELEEALSGQSCENNSSTN